MTELWWVEEEMIPGGNKVVQFRSQSRLSNTRMHTVHRCMTVSGLYICLSASLSNADCNAGCVVCIGRQYCGAVCKVHWLTGCFPFSFLCCCSHLIRTGTVFLSVVMHAQARKVDPGWRNVQGIRPQAGLPSMPSRMVWIRLQMSGEGDDRCSGEQKRQR